jgi:Tol biopolymer transport system component
VNTLIATRFLLFVVLILLLGTSYGRHVAGDKTQRNGSQKLLTRESLDPKEGSTVAFSTAGSGIGSAWAQTIAALAETSRVSVASDGSQGNSHSRHPSISVDGRFLAFASEASNLVLDDTNGYADIFVHDRQTGQTSRVSVATDGMQANGESWNATISADGRYVAFESRASNLVPAYIYGTWDIFVHDRQTGQTSLVSVASDGTQGDCCSTQPSISANGRYVAFQSLAGNLVSGDTNGTEDIFVHDRQTGQTSLVSVASDGTQGNSDSRRPSISADGRFVAFDSMASNLVAGDINGAWDVFVHDRQTGQTSRVSVASDGTQANGEAWLPSISADGRYVGFNSTASNLVSDDTNSSMDVFVHDRQTGQTSRVSVASDRSQANNYSWAPAVSPDGRFVAFSSGASNLVPGDTNDVGDVFVHDRQTGQTSRVSVASDGTEGNSHSGWPSISADGRTVAFESWASTLVPGDTNNTSDIFVHERSGANHLSNVYLPVVARP